VDRAGGLWRAAARPTSPSARLCPRRISARLRSLHSGDARSHVLRLVGGAGSCGCRSRYSATPAVRSAPRTTSTTALYRPPPQWPSASFACPMLDSCPDHMVYIGPTCQSSHSTCKVPALTLLLDSPSHHNRTRAPTTWSRRRTACAWRRSAWTTTCMPTRAPSC
jgi:hypothetical protein